MEEYYYMFENTLLWGVVIFATCLVAYLGYRQYRTVRVRRVHRRHRARRRHRHSEASVGEAQTNPGHQS
jgi:hypothetical protein